MRLAPLARTTLTIAALGALGAADVGAQRRTFEDSWFWGVKGGGTLFRTRRVVDVVAPGVGAEWLITRTHGALNVSATQYFFDSFGAISDPTNPGVSRTIALHNMRTVGASLFGFPKNFDGLRPYVGIGFNFHLIQHAEPTGTFASAQQRDSVLAATQRARTGTLPVLTLGVQGDRGRASVFFQGGVSPGRRNFVFDNGSSYTFEGGIRYNLTGARERQK